MATASEPWLGDDTLRLSWRAGIAHRWRTMARALGATWCRRAPWLENRAAQDPALGCHRSPTTGAETRSGVEGTAARRQRAAPFLVARRAAAVGVRLRVVWRRRVGQGCCHRSHPQGRDPQWCGGQHLTEKAAHTLQRGWISMAVARHWTRSRIAVSASEVVRGSTNDGRTLAAHLITSTAAPPPSCGQLGRSLCPLGRGVLVRRGPHATRGRRRALC